ncbi:hypothetical protein HRI_000073600 [Hibiscus trionum]|uniref:Uncharacterized protein n=1 Tax=Hibiscus trionum TaxID=183268 RepID=A0A9W7GTF3_HIBTR|nr:hypothetical protein HRI_000073600 [Hibiscus trionum]
MAKQANKKRKAVQTGDSSIRPNLALLFQKSLKTPEMRARFSFVKDFEVRRERAIDLDFLNSERFLFRYLDRLSEWNLIFFLSIPDIRYKQMVLLFYSNARFIHDETKTEIIGIESFILGKKFVVNVALLESIFELKDEGLEDERHFGTFTGRALTLDVHDRVLHLMVSWFIRPSGGKYSHIRQTDHFWLECFRRGECPNVPKIIFAEIVNNIKLIDTNELKSFTYGTILSYIFNDLGIDFTYDSPEPRKTKIGESSLRKSGFTYVNDVWERVDREAVPPPVAPPPQVQVANNEALTALITERFNALDTSIASGFTAMDNRLKNVEDRLHTLETSHSNLDLSFSTLYGQWTKFHHSQVKSDDDTSDDDDEA